MLGCSSNHYAKVSQLDYESIEDVALRKVDDKWSQYDYSFLLGDRSKNYNLIKKHSKIWLKGNKEQHSGNWYLPDFKIMKNPSGFDVSASKKYLATYDANGQIQIMFLDEAKMIFDSILNTPIKKAFFTENDDLFFINAKNEAIVLNFKETKAIYRKGFDITQSFDKVESNKENLIAVHDSTNIYIYDIEKKKQVNSIKNTNPSFYIETLKFFPKSDKIVWVENEKKQNLQVQKEIDLPTAFETKPTPLIIRIAISKDKKTIAFGNTLGDILIYSKKE
jgi:WD40 repeat protein